jgi:hypothetical protein
MRRAAIAIVTLASCARVFGIDEPVLALDAPDTLHCDPTSTTDNPAGCPCETVNATQSCFLGAHGPDSLCSAGGTVSCSADHVWGGCIGATSPAHEVCFDDVDNDCDGVIDNGCTAANPGNLCLDPKTALPYTADVARVNPAQVQIGQVFTVFALSSTHTVAPASFQTSGFCTGPLLEGFTLGQACTGWNVATRDLTATTVMFGSSTGVKPFVIYEQDSPTDPCNNSAPVKVNGSITILP